ncbi:MAG: biotin transporter BioY [Clostridia bacterium]|nr:biotin transporter BioY [Clostridia bacterium]
MKSKFFSVRELVFIALFAAVIAVSAWIAVPAAIPFTMQTFAIFMCVSLLGTKCALASVLTYILLGSAGLPVFAGFGGGVGVLFSPNGGYIIGFLPAVLISGLLLQSFGAKLITRMLCMLAGITACYIFGSVWFCIIHGASLESTLTSCVLPFVPFDAIKIALASILSIRIGKYICLK